MPPEALHSSGDEESPIASSSAALSFSSVVFLLPVWRNADRTVDTSALGETSVLVFLESEEAPAAGLDFLSIENHTVFSRKPS